MDTIILISQLSSTPPLQQHISVYGWVRTKRDTKNICFIEMNDGSTIKGLQAVIDKKTTSLQQVIDAIHTGCSIQAYGSIVPSAGKGQSIELACTELKIIGTAPPEDYPLQKKHHSFEFLRDIAHLRARTNTFAAIARIRSKISYAIHTFFCNRGFLFLPTPIITTNDSEGAGALFRIHTENNKEEFFHCPTYLTVSGQLNAEAYATAVSRVYTFGPTFRAEHSNTTRHLAEFWMIEPEAAFFHLSDNMILASDFLRYLAEHALSECTEDMEFFDRHIQTGLLDAIRQLADAEFIHLRYTEAINILQKSTKPFEHQPVWGNDIQTEHERYLTEEYTQSPVIITDYPKTIKAFYMKQNTDGKTVRGMDVLVPRLGEIIGGSQREDNIDALLARMKELNMPAKKL